MSQPGWQPPEEPHGQQPPYGQQQPQYGPQVPYGQPPQGYGQPGYPPVSPSDERLWGMLAHLGQLLFAFVCPLVIYMIYKDRSRFIRHHAAQALNFAVTCVVYWFALTILTIITLGIGAIFFLGLVVAELVFLILAAVAANRGEWYTYPQFVAFPMFT